MASDSRINVRVTEAYKNKVNAYLEENNISLTELVTKGIDSIINPDTRREEKVGTLELLVKSLAQNVEGLTNSVKTLEGKLTA